MIRYTRTDLNEHDIPVTVTETPADSMEGTFPAARFHVSGKFSDGTPFTHDLTAEEVDKELFISL
jgi:hypothetical protein